LHAGQVGLGPEFGVMNKPAPKEVFKGIREQIKGTITGNQELKQLGHDRRTGALARKQKEEEEDKNSPLKGDEDKSEEKKDDKDAKPKTDGNAKSKTGGDSQSDVRSLDSDSKGKPPPSDQQQHGNTLEQEKGRAQDTQKEHDEGHPTHKAVEKEDKEAQPNPTGNLQQ